MSESRIRVQFQNQEGQTLQGHLHTPVGTPTAWAIFAHCFTCTANIKAAIHIAGALAEKGIATLRFDFTGLGASEGEFGDTNFSSNVDDLIAAAEFLQTEYQAPSILVGHSLGGAAVLAAAPKISTTRAVVTIGSPAAPSHVEHLLDGSLEEIESQGEATVNLGGRPFRLQRQFLKDLRQQEMPEAIKDLRKPLLVMHAPLDAIVSVENATQIFQHAMHPKSFVSLDSADHLLSNEDDARYAGHLLAAWAARYVPTGDDEDVDSPTATIARTAKGSFTTNVLSAGHTLVADEPKAVGGADLGPTPYDYLSTALAACTTMTLQMYAAHKKLDLQEAIATVEHHKIHAKDCEDCETTSGKVDQFDRILKFEGDLTDAEIQRLVEIADRCPVHRTLHSEVKIRTRLDV